MEVPLLSQDEFFRHLNLRSVHATSAKYHYRQALKERLRASSQLQSQSLPKIIMNNIHQLTSRKSLQFWRKTRISQALPVRLFREYFVVCHENCHVIIHHFAMTDRDCYWLEAQMDGWLYIAADKKSSTSSLWEK